MNTPRTIDAAITDTQTRASNPEVSAFVSANAGAGKTHVLVQRVIRLLLKGTAPEKILCITFTKAAAANMAQRVFETLGHWVSLDDRQLDDALLKSGIAHPDRFTRHQARQLFARALETPGGLKVQTIHALCTRLLQQFPFESNVPARFAVLDDRDQSEMMERASLKVLLAAADQTASVTGRALATAMMNAADVTFRDVVREACLSRDHFMAWSDGAGTVDAAIAQLSAALGIAPGDTSDSITDAILNGPNLPRADWSRIAGQFDGGSKTDQDKAECLRAAATLTGEEQVDEYLSVFFTDKGEPRKSLATKALAKVAPSLPQLLSDEQLRLEMLCARRAAVKIRERTQALLVIAAEVAAHYRHEKQERGLLDYDDLIDKTRKLLTDASAGWVHYKLDRGIDHVLIDEAQDTSPKQWDIITRLIDDFTSGAGARDGVVRTIFAVGDEKQSIFSFQGAAPREFDERKSDFQKKFTAAKLAFDPVKFTYSFRSGVSILQSVQATFRAQDVYRSITTDKDGMPPHMALKDAAPSIVDLWELQEPNETQDLEGWRAPFDAVAEQSPEVKLAQRMARQISYLTRNGSTGRAGERKKLTAGDILILVRRRGKLFDAVIQALKHAGVPVAGADRLKLTEHIAIIDLMNLGDAILLPQDDLALAVALKSPIFGVSEEQLFTLAFDRRKKSLRQSLAEHAKTDPAFTTVLKRLVACETRAMNTTPFAFYSWLLGGDGGRRRIFQRLNHEPGDALDEFLQLALTYEQREPASLQGFMAWLRAADIEIKRDMELSRDEVRVMTVHGSKGLEAPVVFLMDTTSSPMDSQRLNLIPLTPGGCVVWGGRQSDDPPAVTEARARMKAETENEYRRLLYVAMTRAAERLVIGGTMPGNRKEVGEQWWYHLIRQGLETSELTETVIETPDGVVRRFSRPDDLVSLPVAVAAPTAPAATTPLPAWLRQETTVSASAFDLRRPSDAGDHDGTKLKRGEADDIRRKALQRGILTHRLLQSLPDIPDSRRGEAAAHYLLRNAGDWPGDERNALASQVLALMADSRFAGLFAAGSRAEVSIAGKLDRPGRSPLMVSGQIDRLVVSDREVLIADYKTNHAPPREAAHAPQAYIQQLALYRAVLARLYPGRPVRGVLVWTEGPEIMEISPAVMDHEMTQIISA